MDAFPSLEPTRAGATFGVRAWRDLAERDAADMPDELVAAAERTIPLVRGHA